MNNNITYDEDEMRKVACAAEASELLKKWSLERRIVTNYDLLNQEKDERKIYELSVTEFKALMVECYEMLEQHKHDMSAKEYKRLTTKMAEEVFIKNGIPVSKEY